MKREKDIENRRKIIMKKMKVKKRQGYQKVKTW